MASIAALVLFTHMATASVIQDATGTNLGAVTTNVNLTAKGPVDWALWSAAGATPSESKSGGTAISDLTITTDAGVSYAVGPTVNALYSWADGTPDATGTDSNPGDPRLTTGTGVDAMEGSGAKLSLTVVGTTSPQTVTIWGCSLKVGATITASLAGSSTVTTQLIRFDNSSNNIWTYSVTFQADNPGDLLTLTVTPYNSWTGNTTQERLGINAAAVESAGFYLLTVNGGAGGGSYSNGAQVEISANAVLGKVFDRWTGDTQHVANVTSSPTTVTMPAQPVSVTAAYVDAPSYTLTGSVAGGNGTVTPASTNVVAGYSAGFVVTANSGYRISTLATNGTPVADLSFGNFSTSAHFTWDNVQSNGALVATFTPQVASSLIMTNAVAVNLGDATNHVDLTATGPVDWSVWGTASSTPLFSKTNGIAISDLTISETVGANYLASTSVNNVYSWTDGASTNNPVGTNVNPLDPRLSSTAAGGNDLEGSGGQLSFTVAGSPSLQTVTIWGCALKVGASITASLEGSNVVTHLARNTNDVDNIWKYSISFRADSTNDVLTLTVKGYDSLLTGTAQERLGIGSAAVAGDQQTTSHGTPYAWMASYYPGLTDSASYEAVDTSDTDGDGLAGWEEYRTGTDPTDPASVFGFTEAKLGGGGFIVTWTSQEASLYSVSTNQNLVYPAWGVAAANIAGQAGTTAYTTTVGNASAFFKVELQ